MERIKPWIGYYDLDADEMYDGWIDSTEAARLIAVNKDPTLYINIHPMHSSPYEDNALGLFFENGVFVGFGTTAGEDYLGIQKVMNLFGGCLKVKNVPWKEIFDQALILARD